LTASIKTHVLYDQIRADFLNGPTFDGSYSSDERAWDALTIADGFDSSRQGMRFNDVIDDPDGLGNSADYDGDAAAWAPFRHTPSTVDTHGFWLASQSKFFDDRLHTLIGIRYDTWTSTPNSKTTASTVPMALQVQHPQVAAPSIHSSRAVPTTNGAHRSAPSSG
jgi:hypothetical protein